MVEPRPVEAEFHHPEQRFFVQIVGFSPAQRGSEIALELTPVGLVRQFLADVTDVEILGAVFPDRPVEFCLLDRLDTGVERVNDRLQRIHFTGVVV